MGDCGRAAWSVEWHGRRALGRGSGLTLSNRIRCEDAQRSDAGRQRMRPSMPAPLVPRLCVLPRVRVPSAACDSRRPLSSERASAPSLQRGAAGKRQRDTRSTAGGTVDGGQGQAHRGPNDRTLTEPAPHKNRLLWPLLGPCCCDISGPQVRGHRKGGR
jgi:hypothetical protein